MAPRVRKTRGVPCRIGEANPPGIFSKAKCVFVSLAGSEYHHANRLQPAAETNTSSQSTRTVVDMASRRADQVEPVYSLLRTYAISTHYALVPLPGPRRTVALRPPRRSSQIARRQPPESLGVVNIFRPVADSCRIRARC